MRQFIFTSGIGTSHGQVSYNALDANKGNLIFHRDADKGGDILYPIHRNNFSAVYASGTAAKKFKAEVTCKNSIYDQTIIFVKKGVQFNERNKWSVTVHVHETATAANIASKLAEEFKRKPDLKDKFTVVVAGAKLTIEATNLIKGEAWTIVMADGQEGVKPNILVNAEPGFLDADYVKDLAAKCISELGYNSTYVDAAVYLLPGSDNIGNPKDVAVTEGSLYKLLTLRFAEPRDVKTRDEVVNQIVQVCGDFDLSSVKDFDTFVSTFGQKENTNESTSQE